VGEGKGEKESFLPILPLSFAADQEDCFSSIRVRRCYFTSYGHFIKLARKLGGRFGGGRGGERKELFLAISPGVSLPTQVPTSEKNEVWGGRKGEEAIACAHAFPSPSAAKPASEFPATTRVSEGRMEGEGGGGGMPSS